MNPIDLRSDTVTRPTQAMRAAMASADVGDDVLGEDPTLRELEEYTATILGKEAALFVPSGTMANQLAVRAQTRPGDELFVEAQAHLYYYEGGGPAALSGVTCHCIPGERGVFRSHQLEAAIRPSDPHFPSPRMVALENTHNRGGGHVWPQSVVAAILGVARRHGLITHLDGARLWNAAIATGVSELELSAGFDSVSVCFSKSLGAPVGSALAGSKALIDRARRLRKQIGGGMRQAGILAAGALHALHHHRSRLQDDHRHARQLAMAITDLPGIQLDPATVETNIVRITLAQNNAAELAERLRSRGILLFATGPNTLRAVTHLEITDDDIDRAIDTLRSVFLNAS